MKHIFKLIAVLAAMIIGTTASADGPLEYVPPTLTPLTPPEVVNSFSGLYGGFGLGLGVRQVTKYASSQVPVTENLAFKDWRDNPRYRPVSWEYCEPQPDSVLDPHILNNLSCFHDEVVGYETFTSQEEAKYSGAIISAHIGYMHDFGAIIGAGEFEVSYNSLGWDETYTEAKAKLGLDLGRIMPFTYIGYSGDEYTYGGGVSYLLNSGNMITLETTIREDSRVSDVSIAYSFVM